MPAEIRPEDVSTYVARASAGDEPATWELVSGFLGELSAAEVMRDLVAAGQHAIGLCWQGGRCTIRQEHAATAVSQRIVARMMKETPPGRTRDDFVVSLSAERDWHSIANSMLHAVLTADGWSVITLPPGTTAGQLGSVIHDHGPIAVVVTCSMPALLPGARRIVMASQDAGTPAIVGGRAFGSDPRRAQRINANGWASDLLGVPAAVAAHGGFSPPSERIDHPSISEYSLLRSQLGSITATIQDAMPRHIGGAAEDHVGAALWILRSLSATLLCDDPTILAEDIAWSRDRSWTGAPAPDPLVDVILDALPDDLPLARQLLMQAR